MPKVRNTEIDDDFNEENNKKHKRHFNKHEFDTMDFEDDETEKVNIAPPMIQVDGVGLFRLHSINCVEREFKISESVTGSCKPLYGLTINKGMTPSSYFPKVDVTLWYDNEISREKVYNNIIIALQACGTEIYEV